MFIQELMDIDPSTLDDDTNVYEVKTHMPYPTLNHVFAETGIDMLGGIGELEAKATLRYMTKFAMNMLKSGLPYQASRDVLEFLIAKSRPYREAFIDVVCQLVLTTRGKGIADFLATGGLSIDDLPKLVQASAKASGLDTQFYSESVPQEIYRGNY